MVPRGLSMAADELQQQPLHIPPDDAVITFRTVKSAISGRLVRLGAVADAILSRHANPAPVSVELGEALSLAALLGSALPREGRMTLQTRTDGAVTCLVADCDSPGRLRGYARYDKEKLAELTPNGAAAAAPRFRGQGHLAITIEAGAASERYQGVVALDGGPMSTAAKTYFENSEALPTFVRLAVARHFQAGQPGAGTPWQWRAGGIMLQHISGAAPELGAPEAGPRGAGDENWVRVRTLAETIEDHELLDPVLTPEQLLLRLFHEEGVIVLNVQPLAAFCRCSRDRVFNVLKSFGVSELSDMKDETGRITATCEFCTTLYAFEPSEIADASRD